MKSVHIIGVPLDLGGGRRGVDMGPSAFRIAGIGEQLAALGYTVVDKGDLPTPIPETQELRDEHKKYIRDIAKVCQKLYQTALGSFDEGAMPVVLGGDHSLGAGSVAAAAEWGRTSKQLPIGLLWVDAHADMRTFPDDDAIARLQDLGVRYVLVHQAYYDPDDYADLMEQILHRAELRPIGRYRDWLADTQIFELERAEESIDLSAPHNRH